MAGVSVFNNYYCRIAREVKNSKDYFLNWPVNQPVKLGQYGFYRGKNVRFDWQGNVENFGIRLSNTIGNMPIAESYRSGKGVDVSFDVNADTPASATLTFRKKHAVAFESHGGTIDTLEVDRLHEEILNAIRDGRVTWNPEWVVVTQIYRTASFSSFVSGSRDASVRVIASGAPQQTTFGLADPNAKLSLGASSGMTSATVAEQNALPYFVVSKLKGRGMETRLERYG